MTVDELRTRKRELLERQREELALQEQGKGDTFALFFVREELLDVNAQLRALSPRRRVGMGRADASAADRQQYADWLHQEAEDAPVGAAESVKVLTERQREVWEMHLGGMTDAEIAHRLWVNQSTIRRTLRRAQAAMQAEIRRAAAAQEADTLDMADPAAAELVLGAVTATQAAYLYLYYAEWLSLREISALTGNHYTAVWHTLQRGLRNIGGALGYQSVTLVHMEALDELVYSVYAGLEEADTIVPQERRPSAVRRRGSGDRLPPAPPVEIQAQGSLWTWQRRCDRRRGKLLTALLERKRQGESVGRWLLSVFRRLAGKAQKSAARWVRHRLEARRC